MTADVFDKEVKDGWGTTNAVEALLQEKYHVLAFDKEDGMLPVLTFATYGNWELQNGFLIVWDAGGLKHAHRLPNNIILLRTEPTGVEEVKDAVDHSTA